VTWKNRNKRFPWLERIIYSDALATCLSKIPTFLFGFFALTSSYLRSLDSHHTRSNEKMCGWRINFPTPRHSHLTYDSGVTYSIQSGRTMFNFSFLFFIRDSDFIRPRHARDPLNFRRDEALEPATLRLWTNNQLPREYVRMKFETELSQGGEKAESLAAKRRRFGDGCICYINIICYVLCDSVAAFELFCGIDHGRTTLSRNESEKLSRGDYSILLWSRAPVRDFAKPEFCFRVHKIVLEYWSTVL